MLRSATTLNTAPMNANIWFVQQGIARHVMRD